MLSPIKHSCISIHALREEGDRLFPRRLSAGMDFYPRPPRGGRHNGGGWAQLYKDFYPRPPRGGRPFWYLFVVLFILFLSTPSARRATVALADGHIYGQFLSTPSARRATRRDRRNHRVQHNFYPRPPRGGRPVRSKTACLYNVFLSTPSARRATLLFGGRRSRRKFLSTPSARRATAGGPLPSTVSTAFLSTPSARRATRSG